jgi:YVTN family beta-propeller protein
MNDRSFIMTRYKTRGWLEVALLVVFLITPGVSGARENDIGHPTFLSPHASPILKSGGHVFVVNTPADTVDVIDASSRAVIKRINVGVDPVGIAARPDGMEIWVSCCLRQQ